MKTNLIGFHGRKKSGKTTAAILLQQCYSDKKFHHVNFADALKEEVSTALGISMIYLNEHKDNFRLILQGWGTDYRRKLCSENYWIDKWKEKVKAIWSAHPDTIILTSDVRFQNELQCVIDMCGHVYEIVDQNNPNRDYHDTHESEQHLHGIHPDFVIYNDFKQGPFVFKEKLKHLIK